MTSTSEFVLSEVGELFYIRGNPYTQQVTKYSV